VTCFLQGHFTWAMAYHPLGPVFATMFVLMGAMAVLPARWRNALIVRIERWDKLLGVMTVLFVVLLIGYGLFRLSLVASGDPDLAWWRTSGAPPFVTTE
jgi:hypothetical protein